MPTENNTNSLQAADKEHAAGGENFPARRVFFIFGLYQKKQSNEVVNSSLVFYKKRKKTIIKIKLILFNFKIAENR